MNISIETLHGLDCFLQVYIQPLLLKCEQLENENKKLKKENNKLLLIAKSILICNHCLEFFNIDDEGGLCDKCDKVFCSHCEKFRYCEKKNETYCNNCFK